MDKDGNVLKVVYTVDNDDMSDQEYEDQEEQIFYVSEELFKSFIDQHGPANNRVDDFYLTKL